MTKNMTQPEVDQQIVAVEAAIAGMRANRTIRSAPGRWRLLHEKLSNLRQYKLVLTPCTCDKFNEDNDTVCPSCWARGRRNWGDVA